MRIRAFPASIIYAVGINYHYDIPHVFCIKEASERTILGDSIKFTIGDIQWKPKQSAMLIFSL